MQIRKVALIVPCNKYYQVILQRRKGYIKKPTDKDFGFFGGHLEEGENAEQALKKEVNEELSLDVSKMKSLKHFNDYAVISHEKSIKVELSVFICEINDVVDMEVHEGKPATLGILEAIKSNISDIDKQILSELYEHIKSKNKIQNENNLI